MTLCVQENLFNFVHRSFCILLQLDDMKNKFLKFNPSQNRCSTTNFKHTKPTRTSIEIIALTALRILCTFYFKQDYCYCQSFVISKTKLYILINVFAIEVCYCILSMLLYNDLDICKYSLTVLVKACQMKISVHCFLTCKKRKGNK